MAAKRKSDGKTKHCARPGCGLKPIAEFPINRAMADGRAAYCRPCKRLVERERKNPPSKKSSSSKPKNLTAGQPIPRKPGARGPPSTITPELIEQLCEPLRRGHSRRASAKRLGVLEDTFAQWMKRGSEETSGPTRELYLAVTAAEGEGEYTLLEKVREAAEIDPHQARWMLERRYSQGAETWVRKEHIDVTAGPEMPEVSVVRELLFTRLKGLGGGGAAGTPVDAGGGGPAAGAAPSGGVAADGATAPPAADTPT